MIKDGKVVIYKRKGKEYLRIVEPKITIPTREEIEAEIEAEEDTDEPQ